MDNSWTSREGDKTLANGIQDDDASIRRMLRLYEDLGGLAEEMEPDDTLSLHIVQRPEKIYVDGGSSTPDVSPLLAAVLRASLERRIAIAEQVRAKLAPTWQALPRQG